MDRNWIITCIFGQPVQEPEINIEERTVLESVNYLYLMVLVIVCRYFQLHLLVLTWLVPIYHRLMVVLLMSVGLLSYKISALLLRFGGAVIPQRLKNWCSAHTIQVPKVMPQFQPKQFRQIFVRETNFITQ